MLALSQHDLITQTLMSRFLQPLHASDSLLNRRIRLLNSSLLPASFLMIRALAFNLSVFSSLFPSYTHTHTRIFCKGGMDDDVPP